MARSPEFQIYDYLRRKAKGWKLQRHEDRFSSGIPDLSFVSEKNTGWIECKACRGNERIHVRPGQINWLCDRARFPHFFGFLLCRVDGKTWMVARIHEKDRTVLDTLRPSTWGDLTETYVGDEFLSFIRDSC